MPAATRSRAALSTRSGNDPAVEGRLVRRHSPTDHTATRLSGNENTGCSCFSQVLSESALPDARGEPDLSHLVRMAHFGPGVLYREPPGVPEGRCRAKRPASALRAYRGEASDM